MEIKILDSILHGVLKPWKIDTDNTRHFTELVKAANAVSPIDNVALLSLLTLLLIDYPDLQKILQQEALFNNEPLQNHLFKIELPKYKDSITQFYYLIISSETLLSFNTVLYQSKSWTDLVDIRYQIGKTLTNIKVLAIQATTELNDRGFASVPDEQSSLIHFVLYYLKHSLIQLYFNIQETFKQSLQQVTTLEDFYLLDLQQPLSSIQELEYTGNVEDPNAVEQNVPQQKLCFGFKDDVVKLQTVINQLCFKIDLLNEEVSSAEELLKVFTTQKLLPKSTKIQINCETRVFRYVLDKLRPFFNDLSLANIEKSLIFYSKNDTLLTANNLYVSNKNSSGEPKEKETIDKIFKQMQ